MALRAYMHGGCAVACSPWLGAARGCAWRHWPGLRISVENQAKSLHAVAYVKPVLFNRYTYFGGAPHASAADVDSDSDDGEADNKFRINLSSWLDCLNVFGRFLPRLLR